MNAFAPHYPNCGAAADPEARRCLYSRARLAEGGGLDRARQHEKDELETERQRLAMRQAQLDAHQFRGIQVELC